MTSKQTTETHLASLTDKQRKALSYIASGRVLVMVASKQGIRIAIKGSNKTPYITRYGCFIEGSGISAECSCEHGQIHTNNPMCCHVEIAKMLWGHGLKGVRQ